MLAATLTRSGTGTMPYTSVVHITRKVQTDMLEIGDTYAYFTEKYAQDVIHDVRIFIDEEIIDKVEFVWLEAGTNQVLDALRYVVLNGVVGLADDRPGGIRYDPILASADFRVRVYYNSRWTTELDETELNSIRSGLTLTWGPGGQLDYSGGRWMDDRTYSMDTKGFVRQRFVR
jgi:Bacterial HORMA domain family 1